MHKFDYSFLKSGIPGDIVGLTAVITDLKRKEEIRKLQYNDSFEKLKQKAIIESVKGSNAIEGIVTTDSRIRDIVAGAAPVTHDELEITGYKDALNLIHSEYGHINVSEKTVLQFHKMLLEQSSPTFAGQYKSADNYIMEYRQDGTRRIRFKPTPANMTAEAMEQLLLAYCDARQDSSIHPLLLIPCFILDFLCIHPFGDGNGRISRLLTVLLLHQSGFDIVRYISVENQINKYKENYYAALEQASVLWHEGKNNYVPFIVNFLQILYKCFKELDEAFMDISLKKAKKSERVENILLNSIVPLSKRDIADKVPDISIKTIELVLKEMLDSDLITKIGTYKDARYMRK